MSATMCSEKTSGDTNEESLIRQRIREENEFIKKLIDMIPPRFYFDSETREIINKKKHLMLERKLKEQKRKLKNQKISNAEISNKAKHKRAKFDPTQFKTVTQLQIELNEESTGKSITNGLPSQLKDSFTMNSSSELRERLQAKLQQLRGKRRNILDEESREKLKQKRKLSRLRAKQKKKLEKNKGLKVIETSKLGKKDEKLKLAIPSKPVYNKEGKMVFSKFDFSECEQKKKKDKLNLTGKDYKTLIEKVKKEKSDLEEIQAKDPEKAQNLQNKKLWNKAVQKAEGVKVKDDIELLKKAMKKKEQRKKKSKKQWENRNNMIEERKQKQQQKRKENIKQKKQEKIKKKIKRSIKKGRMIPGFS